MKGNTKRTNAILAFGFAAAAILAAPTAAFAADGPDIFRAQKCTECHSVKSAGIAQDAGSTEKVHDLSEVGNTHDKKFFAKFLLKQETLNGEKHKKAFGGTKEELKTVATWLESLKK